MSLKTRYELPSRSGDVRHLGCLIGAAGALECAQMMERHQGPVVIVTRDMQNALRLRDEMQQFSHHPIETLSDWETLPYDNFSPHQEIISHRLSTLYHLPTMQKGALILPVNTLMQKVCPSSFLTSHALVMAKGDKLSRENLTIELDKAGYRHVEQVLEHGEYAIRGALLDLFPMGSSLPFRLDFFDDEIDSLRTFDVDSQRTLDEVTSINLLPAHEFPTDKEAIERFRSQWRERFEVRRDPEHIYQQVSKNTLPTGIEYWQPLFFPEPLSSLFDYFPDNTLFVSQSLQEAAERFQSDTQQRFESRSVDPMRPLLPPADLWLTVEQLNQSLKKWPRVQLSAEKLADKAANTNLDYLPLPDISTQGQSKTPLEKLRQFIEQFDGTVVFSVESEGRRETVTELLARLKIRPEIIDDYTHQTTSRFAITLGAAEHGFIQSSLHRALICESDLLGERVVRRRADNRRTINTDTLIRNLAELRPGQPVVHI
ncbi:MAG: transcription-repair coupling factor, partial [Providencia sp.]